MNRFKGLDLVDRAPEDLWAEVYNNAQESVTKTFPKPKKCSKTKWLAVLSDLVVSDSATPWTVARQAPLSMGILQAGILQWVAMPSFRGSLQPRDRTQVPCIAGRFYCPTPGLSEEA